MPTETVVGVEVLLEHERWVKRLARALVRDDDEAEDVIQEVRVTSWQRPPRDPDRARSWLGTVVRNMVRNRKRDEGTRQRIEGQLATVAGAVPAGFWAGKERLPVTPAARDYGEGRLQVLTVTVE
jgi:DNA-directed RNA polymerase specialized sigma24 family protein